ncbi:MAG TPA: sulfite exporter TauE/SafE family protein [Azospirillum sp.]
MYAYLPIAGISVNVPIMLALGGSIGFLSGLLGVGGGFLLTPLLTFMGVPPSVAVATGANQLVGASVSGVITHWHRGNVDVKMGLILLAGGFAGSSAGVWLFALLRSIGQVDIVIALSYVLVLGTVGAIMLRDGVLDLMGRGRNPALRRKKHAHPWIHRLPFRTRFKRSRLYISVIPPVVIGVVVGVLSAIMGVGGGFVMVPAMIYLLEMPTAVTIGTSLFQIIFVAANATFLQATMNHTVDAVLAVVLLTSGVIGAQVGARWSSKVPARTLRILLALMVVGVAVKMAVDLALTPAETYSIVRKR